MHNKSLWLLASLLSFATLSGCTSWLNPPQQNISVLTLKDGQPVSGQTCQVSNDKGHWSVITPGKVVVQTSDQNLIVQCNSIKQPSDESTGISSAVATPWPGYLEHWSTGVFLPVASPSAVDQRFYGIPYRYPETIEVILGQNIILTADLPDNS